MNSYERFDAILNGDKPDKMPFYFPAIACSVASEILGKEAHTGADSLRFKEEMSWLQGENAHQEFLHKYHEDTILLHRTLGADIIREAWRGKARPSKKIDDYTLLFGDENGPHIVKRFFPKYQSYGVIEDTTKKPSDTDELKKVLTAQMNNHYTTAEEDLYDIYKDQIILKNLAAPYFPAMVCGLGLHFPMDDIVWLEATILEPTLLREYYLFQAQNLLKHVAWLKKQGFRFINAGSDIASNSGPIFSPASFKEIFVPALALLAAECKKHDMIYCYRTDGNIWSIADFMFNDSGIQAFGEVDRMASMLVGKLREIYPDITILGNVCSATINMATTDDVRKMTRETLEESKGLRYIPGPSNAIMHGTKISNIYAMIEEIENFKP